MVVFLHYLHWDKRFISALLSEFLDTFCFYGNYHTHIVYMVINVIFPLFRIHRCFIPFLLMYILIYVILDVSKLRRQELNELIPQL